MQVTEQLVCSGNAGLSAKLQQPQTGFSQQPAAMPRLQKAMLGTGLNNLVSQPPVQQQQNTAGGQRFAFSKRVSTGQPTPQQPSSMSQQQQPDDQESQAMLRTGLGNLLRSNLVSQPPIQQQQNTAGGPRFGFSKLVSTGQPTPQQPGSMTQQQQQQQQPGDQDYEDYDGEGQ